MIGTVWGLNYLHEKCRRNMELLDDGHYFPALVAEKLSEGERSNSTVLR